MPKPNTLTQTDTNGVPLAGQIETFEMKSLEPEVGELIKFGQGYGTAAQRKIVWRVVSVPDPKASRRVLRECIVIEPVTGGRPVAVYGFEMVETTEAERARYANVEKIDPIYRGDVVTHDPHKVRLSKANADTKFVVLAVGTDGTAMIAPLNGGGVHYSKIPMSALVPFSGQMEV